ncbi:MAG: class I SAM-dependent methyltransferase [Clostridia bacterium]|nr:class I SAM-dependent methyltransferase [Clostridia bacterium]
MNQPDYKNWIPKWMICSGAVGTAVSVILLLIFIITLRGTARAVLSIVFALASVLMCVYLVWSVIAYNAFSYTGRRRLSKDIIESTAGFVKLESGQTALDIGCGSGALAIAVAKRNPSAKVIGCDRWGKEYAEFSMKLCADNAKAEKAENVVFQKGDATALPFADEQFDAVVSNYVYHNIPTKDRQAVLLETLRTLKKGGTFAIHDIFSRQKYGDMDSFIRKLYDMGYEKVELINTTNGRFMSAKESKLLFLRESKLLVGKK